jgi:hypothetical protein
MEKNHVIFPDSCPRCRASMVLLQERPGLMKDLALTVYSEAMFYSDAVYHPVLHRLLCRYFNSSVRRCAAYHDRRQAQTPTTI